ncbi:hypothetical protein [Candidatus Korobacter versatilis]|uniref:hypothetical protein n=1 Tax=Candidatus Korobacter versatilis TaxID=658062 RepID=UPI0002FB6EA8|nr:hypothetical protein [Candidatus Koribacter versatilis]
MIVGVTILLALGVMLVPRVAQPAWYHDFADKRGLLGIPNFGDVASNIPFAILGVLGLVFLLQHRERFVDRREQWPYLAVFVGLVLTCVGSSYYHLAPDNARLLWDRIPMTIVFMGMVASVIAERISLKAGLVALPFLLALGVLSVLQWYRSELLGAGDLRFYASVQIYAGAILLVALLLRPKYTRSSDLAIVVGWYVVAKLLESFDKPIFSVGHIVSGHTLKHLAGAAAGFWILRMLQRREPIAL